MHSKVWSSNKTTHSFIQHLFFEKEREVLNWPPYIHDLNVIVILWAIVKRMLAERTVLSESLEEKFKNSEID